MSSKSANHWRVLQLTHRRKCSFEYLRRLFVGEGHYMGIVSISIATLVNKLDLHQLWPHVNIVKLQTLFTSVI